VPVKEPSAELVDEPTSFFVTKDNHLEPQEAAHARDWGKQLAAAFVAR